MRRVAAIAFGLALIAPACRAEMPEPPPLHWQKSTLTIVTASGAHKFDVEISDDEAKRERGLMYRKTMARDAGMIFDFGIEEPVEFWMKNTVLPLDMVFIKSNGTVFSEARNAVPFSETRINAGGNVRAVLEVNAGVAEEIGLQPGDVVHAAMFGNALP